MPKSSKTRVTTGRITLAKYDKLTDLSESVGLNNSNIVGSIIENALDWAEPIVLKEHVNPTTVAIRGVIVKSGSGNRFFAIPVTKQQQEYLHKLNG